MSATPALSVVVPFFDSAGTIVETLDSVCRQGTDLESLELILVDDGSRDDGLERALSAVAGTRLHSRVIRHARNLGASVARNDGIKAARADWVHFLDSDDLVGPRGYEVLLQGARNADPTVAVVHSRWGRLFEEAPGRWTKSADTVLPDVGEDAALDLLRDDNFLATGSYIVRRAAIQRVGGYDESFLIIQDVALLLSLALDGARFQRVPSDEPVSWYRIRDGSLSRSNQARFIEECVRNAQRAEAVWSGRGGLTASRRRLLSSVYFMAARYRAEHDPAAFDTTLRQLRAVSPSFVPAGPAGLRHLSRLVGYPTAERLAVRYRRLRRLLAR